MPSWRVGRMIHLKCAARISAVRAKDNGSMVNLGTSFQPKRFAALSALRAAQWLPKVWKGIGS